MPFAFSGAEFFILIVLGMLLLGGAVFAYFAGWLTTSARSAQGTDDLRQAVEQDGEGSTAPDRPAVHRPAQDVKARQFPTP